MAGVFGMLGETQRTTSRARDGEGRRVQPALGRMAAVGGAGRPPSQHRPLSHSSPGWGAGGDRSMREGMSATCGSSAG
eukprot:4817930-Prymnesium_polylepis.1